MTNKNKIISLVILFSVALNIWFGVAYFQKYGQAQNLQSQAKSQLQKKAIAGFLNLFIQKVLESNTEVSFNDRLKLENAVRDLNDPQLLAQWQKFTNATTQDQVQLEAKNLLAMLAQKITLAD